MTLAEVAESANASVSNAVLAAIAASDAACCAAIGERSRGQAHDQAADLLGSVEPGGPQAAKALRRVLGLKDAAQYGVSRVSDANRKTAIRQATVLVEFAGEVLER